MFIICKVCGQSWKAPFPVGDQIRCPGCGRDVSAGVRTPRVRRLLAVIHAVLTFAGVFSYVYFFMHSEGISFWAKAAIFAAYLILGAILTSFLDSVIKLHYINKR